MFMLRNVSKLLFGDRSKESIIELQQGQLYLVRPLSPKGYSELIFRDAAAFIRRTGQEYQYQLVIQRVFEEGEEELLAEENGGDELAGAQSGSFSERDEKIFLLDEALHFRSELRDTGEKVFAWRDYSGDPGDLFEFVCDESTSAELIAQVEIIAKQCQYERKFRRSSEKATEKDLAQFTFEEEIPAASPTISRSPSVQLSPVYSRELHNSGSGMVTTKKKERKSGGNTSERNDVANKDKEKVTVAPLASKRPSAQDTLTEVTAELHLFDFESGTFILQDSSVKATVEEIGLWTYWLQITGTEREWLGQGINAEINPVFNFEYKSFIFNHYTDDNSAYSWLLRFEKTETLETFQEALMRAIWQHVNETKWNPKQEEERERDYVLNSFDKLVLEDDPEQEGEEEEESEEEENADESEGTAQPSEDYDTDESHAEDENDTRDEDRNANSQLAVGYKHDRSFVVRGSKIGVFKHTPDNRLEFSTTINKVQTPKGNVFSPKKVMLHSEDKNLLLQNEHDPHSVYKMDLEYGKVVDEWKVHDDINADIITPVSKFAQMQGEQTVLGLSNNALYQIDPRLSGNKLVDSKLKQYATKNGFSAAATTEQGYIAVASTKGDIRMFDRLGINAKTHVPALGDPITGLDVSANGRWVLATTRTYLLLVDTLQREGKYEGKLGFERSFAKDAKPQPRRLTLKPSHVAQFQHETGVSLSFKPARFNTGTESKETTIITATGPFIITWNLKYILANRAEPYQIKRYSEEVKADDFKFGTDKSLIVALPNEVNMVGKRSLQKPTRESIATPYGIGGGRRSSSRKSYLTKRDIVNSPY